MHADSTIRLDGQTGVVASVVARAAQRRSSAVVGPSGSGKTRVLQTVLGHLRKEGRTVAELSGTASSGAVPFGVFLRVLDVPTSRRIAQADPLGRALMLRAAVLDLRLDAIVLDDLSDVDPASAAFLLELAQSGVPVVASLAPGRRRPDGVDAYLHDPSVAALTLRPLSVDDCAAFAAAVLRAPVDSGAARALAQASAGRPGLLREVIRESMAAGDLVRATDLWHARGELRPPRTLRSSLEERLRATDPAVRSWVATVALADQVPMDVTEHLVAPAVSDRAEQEGWTVFDAGVDAYRLRQRAWRSAIADVVGRRGRQLVLRSLTAVFTATARPLTEIERVAVGEWRLELGEPIDPAEALELARLTSISAPRLCERLLREAVIRGGGATAEIALAEQLKRTDRIDEAEALLGAAQPTDARTFGHLAATLAIVTGIARRRSTETLAVVDAQLARHPDDPDLLAVRIALLLRERRLAEARDLADRIALPRRPGFAPVFAGIHQALLEAATGDGAAALAAVDELREPARATTDRVPEGPVTMDWLAGFIPVITRLDVATAAPIAIRNYDRMLETGLHAARTQFAHLLAVCRILQGDPRHAAHLLREAEESVGIWHDSWLPRITASLVEALLLSGQTAAARDAFSRLEAMAMTADHEGVARLAAAHLAAHEGRAADGARLARSIAEQARRQGALVEAFDALHAAIRFGDPTAAEALLALGPLPDGPVRQLQRAHARALLSEDAAALDDVAQQLWALDQRLLAIEIVHAALEQHPEDRWADARRARLARWRLETPTLHLQTAGTASSAPSPLTRREQEVALLAARGLPDRAIASELDISLRTAQTHLGRVFGKLGVHRRTELAGKVPAD